MLNIQIIKIVFNTGNQELGETAVFTMEDGCKLSRESKTGNQKHSMVSHLQQEEQPPLVPPRWLKLRAGFK